MTVDPRVAPYLGRLLDADESPAGTCFQVISGVLVTAWHVLDDLGAGTEGAIVRLDPLQGGGPARDAKVERADPLHDLAVLVTGEPLAGCVAGLAASDEVAIRAEVVITGVPVLDDPGRSYRSLDAEGHWGGGTTRDDQVPLGRVVASAVMRGMSGAPVLAALSAQGRPRVVGVVSARYNSIDGWGRDSVSGGSHRRSGAAAGWAGRGLDGAARLGRSHGADLDGDRHQGAAPWLGAGGHRGARRDDAGAGRCDARAAGRAGTPHRAGQPGRCWRRPAAGSGGHTGCGRAAAGRGIPVRPGRGRAG